MVFQGNHGFYPRLVAYGYFWLSERAYREMGDSVPKHTGPISLTDNPLEPSISRTRPPTSERIPEMESLLHRRCSRCLPMQLFGARQPFFPQPARFLLFETVQSIWKKSRKSKLPVLEFSYQQSTHYRRLRQSRKSIRLLKFAHAKMKNVPPSGNSKQLF